MTVDEAKSQPEDVLKEIPKLAPVPSLGIKQVRVEEVSLASVAKFRSDERFSFEPFTAVRNYDLK